MIKTRVKRLLTGSAAIAAASASSLMFVAPASADTITQSTTCTNPYTAAQAGPSSFDVQIPSAVSVGQAVPITVSFTFTNNSGYTISDLNSFTQSIATTGPADNPTTVTAGSQGSVANGSSVTVTESGTWTPSAAGTATFTLGNFSFNTVVFGLTVPVSCTFDATPAAVTSTAS
jgi:hypothetical protein